VFWQILFLYLFQNHPLKTFYYLLHRQNHCHILMNEWITHYKYNTRQYSGFTWLRNAVRSTNSTVDYGENEFHFNYRSRINNILSLLNFFSFVVRICRKVIFRLSARNRIEMGKLTWPNSLPRAINSFSNSLLIIICLYTCNDWLQFFEKICG
jgi:hypothetical protein